MIKEYYKPKQGGIYDYETRYETVANELLTKAERLRKFPNIGECMFTKVKVNIKNTFILFGVRFEI